MLRTHQTTSTTASMQQLLILRVIFIYLLSFLLSSSSSAQIQNASAPSSLISQPNIILFMTDDQDVTAHSLDYMPRLNQLFRKEGMEFLHYYVPTGLCCPSRTTILRGQYCHNTEIYDNGDLSNGTYQSGAWEKFLHTGLENETIATVLQSVGYETALVGKYMNGYMGLTAVRHKPPGFDHWMGMVQLDFYGPSFSNNGEFFPVNKTVYQTDFIRDWAVDFITKKRNQSKPFFLMVTPYAPHAPATPAKRHEDMFQDAKVPRYDSFNPPDDVQRNQPSWIQDLPLLTHQQIDTMDIFYRNRLRSLQAIDEALESLVYSLHDFNLDDNTYVFYTSDNGQHFGDFRIPAGKRQSYETDVLVPFLVRGPGVKKGTKVNQVMQSVDLAATFLDLASRHSDPLSKLSLSYAMDGKSMGPILTGELPINPAVNEYRWAALLEMYGGSSNIGLRYQNMTFEHGRYYRNHMYPNTYQAVRIVNGPTWASEANLLYVEWCTGEMELYNVTQDPHQIQNIADIVDLDLVNHLNKLLVGLGDCKGSECYSLDTFTPLLREDDITAASQRRRVELRTLDSIRVSIKERLPCHNPTNMFDDNDDNTDVTLGRKQFARDLPVPEPFTYGFPYSDGDDVPDDLLEIWSQYEHYFH